jgi:hypothetical protein
VSATFVSPQLHDSLLRFRTAIAFATTTIFLPSPKASIFSRGLPTLKPFDRIRQPSHLLNGHRFSLTVKRTDILLPVEMWIDGPASGIRAVANIV